MKNTREVSGMNGKWPGYWECGPWTSNIWELDRSVKSQTPTQTYCKNLHLNKIPWRFVCILQRSKGAEFKERGQEASLKRYPKDCKAVDLPTEGFEHFFAGLWGEKHPPLLTIHATRHTHSQVRKCSSMKHSFQLSLG